MLFLLLIVFAHSYITIRRYFAIETRPYVQWELINDFMVDVFKAYGVPEEDAKICADVLAFPGIFRGTFDVRASDINEEMKMAAAMALANLISDDELNEEYIIPAAFDPRVGPAVAKAVAEAARATGVARI